jgi:uncharacterized protein (UPF0335 family)
MARTIRSTTKFDEHGDELGEPKRGGRPRKRPMAMGGNVTDETIEEFGNKALTAKLEAEKKRDEAKTLDSEYRGVLKDAKKAGVDPDAIIWWLKARKRETEDLEREILWQNRMAKVMGLPIGTQLGVDFETGETIATTVDKAQMKRGRGKKPKLTNGNGAADPKAAYIMGYDIGKAGKSPKRPGAAKLTGEAAVEFQRGWQQGTKDAAKDLGPQGSEATAH